MSLKTTNSAIDLFVKNINQSDREPLDNDEVPEFLRTEKVDEWGQYYWGIKAENLCYQAESFQDKIQNELPDSFFSLISRYAFPGFEVAPIFFFANTGVNNYWELSKRTFVDKKMSKFLLQNGFIQIGNPDYRNYDPICFDTNNSSDNTNEYQIVQIDHENILCNSKLLITKKVATSFINFVNEYNEKNV